MSILDILKINASGLKAQRTRMQVIASNLANIHTTRTEEGGPYMKKEVVFETKEFPHEHKFNRMLSERIEGVKVSEISTSSKPFEKVYDPGHPDADSEGYVTFPNVNLMEEMADMISATRSYESNINTVNTTKEMYLKTLEICK